MAVRTSDDLIRASIEIDTSLNLSSFMRRANALTDKVAAKDSNSELSTAMLVEIETCLACHFAERRDHAYAEKSTGKAKGIFQGQFGMGLEGTKWGQDAMLLDVTGYLRGLNKGKIKAKVMALGKPPSEQIDYVDRD